MKPEVTLREAFAKGSGSLLPRIRYTLSYGRNLCWEISNQLFDDLGNIPAVIHDSDFSLYLYYCCIKMVRDFIPLNECSLKE